MCFVGDTFYLKLLTNYYCEGGRSKSHLLPGIPDAVELQEEKTNQNLFSTDLAIAPK